MVNVHAGYRSNEILPVMGTNMVTFHSMLLKEQKNSVGAALFFAGLVGLMHTQEQSHLTYRTSA